MVYIRYLGIILMRSFNINSQYFVLDNILKTIITIVGTFILNIYGHRIPKFGVTSYVTYMISVT